MAAVSPATAPAAASVNASDVRVVAAVSPATAPAAASVNASDVRVVVAVSPATGRPSPSSTSREAPPQRAGVVGLASRRARAR